MVHLLKTKRGLLLAGFVVGSLAAGGVMANPGGGGGNGGGGGSTAGGNTSSGSPGGPDSGNNSSGNTGLNNLNCREGFVVDPQKHICVRASLDFPDADLTNHAFSLAEEGRYEEALATLDLLQDPNTAVALNYRGYATRKAGRVDEGIGYYLQAVAIDPAYPQVREYLGEAYVSQGKFDLANEQLLVIASLCGTTCESYTDLAEAIAAAQ